MYIIYYVFVILFKLQNTAYFLNQCQQNIIDIYFFINFIIG